jgi:tetratricopeptide (TPR) repeat protein
VTGYEFAARVIALWDFDDPAGSRARFVDAAGKEPDPAGRQAMLTQVARTHGLSESFEAGHVVLDRLGDPAELSDEPGTRALLERGRLYHLAGDPERAVPLYQAAYERAAAAALSGLALDAAHMVAIALPELAQQEEWTRRGLSIAAGSADPLVPGMVAALLTNLGWRYADEDRWASALDLFDQAVHVRLASAADARTLHGARSDRATALRAVGRHEEALTELRQMVATPEGAADPYVIEEIAANERALGG